MRIPSAAIALMLMLGLVSVPSVGVAAVAGAAAQARSQAPTSRGFRIVDGGGTPAAGAVDGRTIEAGLAPNALVPDAAPTGYPVTGIDVSSHQGDVDWATAASAGADFAYVKATEGTTYINPYYGEQYGGALAAGLYAGAYAFARPDAADPAAQADSLMAAAGAPTLGKTLPMMLDLEAPYFSGPSTCWNLTAPQMVAWISAFVGEVHARTGANMLFYTTQNWWNECTNSSTAFAAEYLDVARWDSPAPTASQLPAGWTGFTFWQYADSGTLPGDQDVFNGSLAQLAAITAKGPVRVLDTRFGTGVARAPLGPLGSVTLTLPYLPAGTTGVVLNLTAVGLRGATSTFISACPAAVSVAVCRQTSAVNVEQGTDIANEITVPVAADGAIVLSNFSGTVDLVADLIGYLGAGYMPTGPTRILDTRSGVGGPAHQVGKGQTITLTVADLPAGTTAVVLNLTATRLVGAPVTYVSACPAALALAACSATSAVNVVAGIDIANELTIPVGADGQITFYNFAGSVDLVGDLAGYLTAGYRATGPTRVLDTRAGVGAPREPVGAGDTVTLTVPALPAGTTAVVLNLTATQLAGTAVSYVSACPAAEPVASCATTSALNVTSRSDIANEITVPVGADGRVTLYNFAGSLDLVADLAGYYSTALTTGG